MKLQRFKVRSKTARSRLSLTHHAKIQPLSRVKSVDGPRGGLNKSYQEYLVSRALPSPFLPFPLFPFSSFPSFFPSSPLLSLTVFSLPYPFPPLPFPPPRRKVAPIQLRCLGSAVSSPSGVRGRAPAANAFLAYFERSKRIWRQRF